MVVIFVNKKIVSRNLLNGIFQISELGNTLYRMFLQNTKE